jgi:hypothetical protein
MAIEIVVVGAEELIDKLKTLQQMNKVRQAIADEGDFLVDKMTNYPVKVYSKSPILYGKGEEADRIRRGFFWHLKNGDISVPYGRTNRLKGDWNNVSANNGWTAVVGNNMPYAPLVQGKNQTKGHQGSGWLTDKQAILVYGAQIQARIIEAVEQEIAEF